jgi:hypothetical protein
MSRVCASVGVANAADRKTNMIFERSRIIAIPAPDLVGTLLLRILWTNKFKSRLTQIKAKGGMLVLRRGMSALGQKQPCAVQARMSALGQKRMDTTSRIQLIGLSFKSASLALTKPNLA